MKKPFFILAYLFLTVPCLAEIIIVDSEWPYDFNNIQAAIDYSSNGDFILVLPGRYTGPGNRDIDFLGKSVTVRSIDPTDPYIVVETIIDCNDLGRGFIFTSGEDGNSVLDGLTITNGNKREGGAIYCHDSSPTITNCTITGNSGGMGGGGIYCSYNSNPVVTNCTITNNSADEGGGICCSYSNPVINNCDITGNSSVGWGGGIHCTEETSSPTIITNCTIAGNSGYMGGGIFYVGDGGSLVITDCIIAGNSAVYGGYGGGICCSHAKITNCTISGNSAEGNGGGIYLEGFSLFVTSSIIWGNSDTSGTGQFAQIYGEQPNVWFSCIQDDNPCDVNIPFGEDTFNIDDDPCFAADGYHLLPNSPCIDTGDPYFNYNSGDIDMDGQPRLMGRCVDMGADEFELAMVVVTKPKAGDVWAAGSTHEINWDSYDMTGTVDIYYSDNNGIDWVKIDNAPDTGGFLWHLPGAVDSNRCLVSVEPNVIVPNLISTTSGLFTIHPCLPGLPVASKWKSLGGGFDRSGLSQNSGPELGCVKWQFHTGGLVSASPSIGAGGRIHLPCEDGILYTLDANGQLLWSYDTNSPLLSSPSIGPDGSLYVGAENGTLYAFDIDGNLRWTHTTDDSIYSSPAVSADGNIFLCSRDGTLCTLGRDGSKLWTFEIACSNVINGAIFASPAIGPDGTLFISGLYDPNLYALDPNTGSVKWTCSFLDPCEPDNSKPQPFASPVVAPDGTIYQALLFNNMWFINELEGGFWYDSRLYAIDSTNGNIIWATNMTETPVYSEQPPPQPPEPYCWFKQYYYDGTYNPTPSYPYTGTYLDWGIFRYYRVSNANWSEPALGPDGTIYVSFDDQYLRAVDPDGSIKWVTSLGWSGSFKLTVGSNGFVYAASNDGWLYVVDPDGEEIARLKSGDWLGFPVIADDGTIIIADSNNVISAVSRDGCEGKYAVLHRLEDLNTDWSVNLIDFAVMADGWLDCTDTSYDPINRTPYCDDQDSVIFLESDINRDQYVDSYDLAALADKWLTQE